MSKRLLYVAKVFMALMLFATSGLSASASDNKIGAPLHGNEFISQQSKDLKVTVFEADGVTPVIGATVIIDGTTTGTITDFDGNASLQGVAKGAIVKVSYQTQSITVGSQAAVTVTLKEDSEMLDEVVVVGYGTQRKSNLTGSVATVNQKALDSRPIQTVSQAIQGQVPGVVAVQNSSQPGKQTASITIRGKNTVNAGGPYVIIDGVPGDMNNIDPNDVESLSILKDAASSAIYGVQAANGVILITTKKGKSGKVRVNYSGNVAFATPTRMPNYLGSYDYAMLYNESQRNENPNITDAELMYSPEDLQKYKDGSSPYSHANTDWHAETFKKFTTETSHYLSISGGNEKTVYSASYGFTKQNGNTDANTYSRNNLRFNVESSITDWLKLGMNLSGYLSKEQMAWDSPQTIMGQTNRTPPTLPVYTDASHSDYAFFDFRNPVAGSELSGRRDYDKTEYTANMYAQVNFLPNLYGKVLYSYRGNYNNDTGFKKSFTYGGTSEDPSYKGWAFPAELREGYDNSYRYSRQTFQALVNYDDSFNEVHNVNVLGGFETYDYNYRFAQASRSGGGNNNLDESLNTLDPENQYAKSGGSALSRMSYFARAQYNFDNRYYIEGNFRADASSRFPENNRWGYFPAVSAAWRITEEAFMEDVDWLSNLKLRLGYGVTGNEEISSYYPGLNTYAYGSYIFGNALYSTTKEARYVNQDLSWARVTNYEGALEIGFLDNRLNAELAVYKKITDDMLLSLPVPGMLGASAPLQNAGAVENTGFDLNLGYNETFGEVGFNAAANVGYVHNELTELRGTEGPAGGKYWYLEGEAIGSFYGYRATGLFASEEEIKNSPLLLGSEKPGDIKYADLNEDGKINGEDREVIGTNFPKVTAGLTLGSAWKNFDLQVFFQGAFGADTYLEGEAAYAFFNGGKVLERHLDRWTPDNLDATYPRITNSYQGNFQTSSYWIQDASYVRLKNVTLGYTFPKSWIKPTGLENVRLYFSGENMLTFTGLDDWDPEIESSGRGWIYGHVKKFSVGLKVGF